MKYPQARYDRFVRRKQSLGYEVGSAALFVNVGLILRDRRAVQAIEFWYPRFRSSEDGRASEEDLEQVLSDALASTMSWLENTEDNVVSIAPYVARRRYQEEHTWKPSPEQLDAAAHAINKAADAELVTHDREQLLWVDYGFRA